MCFFEFLCFFVVCFFRFLLFSFLKTCFRLVFLSFCIYNRTNTYKNRNQQNNSKDNNNKQKQTQKTKRNLPARPLEIFIFRGGSWAGNTVFLFFCFSQSFLFFFDVFFFFVSLCFFLFSPSLFKLLHLQSKKQHI